MDLPDFMKTITINDAAPRAPRALLYIPPGGRPVHCPSVEAAQHAATLYAGEHPGRTVAVYQLIGYAHLPARMAEFTPAESDKARRELLEPLPDTLGSNRPAGGDEPPRREDLTTEQQETLARVREAQGGAA